MRPLLCLLLWSAAAFAQPAPSDSQVLEAILTEIRQLRQDMQATTVASQRVQIVLYRVQAQTAVVAAASQRLNQARAKLAETQAARRNALLQIQQSEDSQKNVPDPDLRKRMEEISGPLRSSIEALGADEQQQQARMTEAEGPFRAEQAKLGELHDQLDKLDKVLESFGRK